MTAPCFYDTFTKEKRPPIWGVFMYQPKIRKQLRLNGYDYSSSGCYFITICTRFMQHWFGEINNRKMNLNTYGKIAHNYWLEIPKHYTNVSIDEFVIMPNHIHGIIVIKPSVNERIGGVDE